MTNDFKIFKIIELATVLNHIEELCVVDLEFSPYPANIVFVLKMSSALIPLLHSFKFMAGYFYHERAK